jgi:chemotaxis family two-component system sensor kinase Cph1
VEVNHAYEVLWGFAAEHTVGKFNVLKSKEVQDSGLLKYLERAYAGESVKLPEYEFDSTGETEGRGLGRKRWLNTRIYPLKDTTGVVKGIVITHEDITDRKQAEKESDNLMRSLESKNKELQSIVYTASHDLKSPLVNIDGFGGELSSQCKALVDLLNDIDVSPDKKGQLEAILQEDIPESLRFIRMGTRKMKELLDGLLRVSRFGSSDIRIKPLDMNGLIKSIIDTMQFQVDEKSISVSIDDLPGCLGDSQQISQVFSNILDNAIKYLDPDRKGTIHVSATTENGQCTYCIEDNGIGIEKNHQEKVFEIFHRLHPTGSIAGEGLGLTIASRILDRHNGTIGLESEPQKGTKFHITLPRA